jgi:hypothetical protein
MNVFEQLTVKELLPYEVNPLPLPAKVRAKSRKYPFPGQTTFNNMRDALLRAVFACPVIKYIDADSFIKGILDDNMSDESAEQGTVGQVVDLLTQAARDKHPNWMQYHIENMFARDELGKQVEWVKETNAGARFLVNFLLERSQSAAEKPLRNLPTVLYVRLDPPVHVDFAGAENVLLHCSGGHSSEYKVVECIGLQTKLYHPFHPKTGDNYKNVVGLILWKVVSR